MRRRLSRKQSSTANPTDKFCPPLAPKAMERRFALGPLLRPNICGSQGTIKLGAWQRPRSQGGERKKLRHSSAYSLQVISDNDAGQTDRYFHGVALARIGEFKSLQLEFRPFDHIAALPSGDTGWTAYNSGCSAIFRNDGSHRHHYLLSVFN